MWRDKRSDMVSRTQEDSRQIRTDRTLSICPRDMNNAEGIVRISKFCEKISDLLQRIFLSGPEWNLIQISSCLLFHLFLILSFPGFELLQCMQSCPGLCTLSSCAPGHACCFLPDAFPSPFTRPANRNGFCRSYFFKTLISLAEPDAPQPASSSGCTSLTLPSHQQSLPPEPC